MIYQYIKLMDENYPVHYILHTRNKAHGLVDMDFEIPINTKLIITPDSSTNDIKQHIDLHNKGIDCICLDHHMANSDVSISPAIIVNNQISPNYSNKDFSGGGIAYEFLRALDDYYWQEYADEFLDLASFANISDVMDLRSAPTRYYVNKGLYNIKNPALQAMIKAQDFSMKGIVNIHNISWYVTPIFNSMIRIGSIEDRHLLFRAFIGDYEEFDYKKRNGDIIKENIYDRVARLCKNTKSKQDKTRDKLLDELRKNVDESDKIIMIQTKNGDSGIVGLSAMKLADISQRPCIVVMPVRKDGQTILGGSARNFNNSPIENLKAVVDSTGLFSLVAGHNGAFGVQIVPENFEQAKETLNNVLGDVVYDPTYMCDFILDIEDLSIRFIQEIDSAKHIWCTGISEPTIAIENISVARHDMFIQGKNQDSVVFKINGIKFVQFKLKDGDPLYDFVTSWDVEPDDIICLNAVGTCSINNYNGILEPQFIINDCKVVQNEWE